MMRRSNRELVAGDADIIKAVDGHIELHIGRVDNVLHEVVSTYVHIDVHHVPPDADRPFYVLVTSGMSERPMRTPPELPEDWRFAELLVCLPSDWPLTGEAFVDERHYWPVRCLKTLARFPHEYGSWLGYGHTVPNGDPAEPLAPGTAQAGFMIIPPLLLGDDIHRLTLRDGRLVRFWSVLPLYPEEMALKLRKGTDALLERLDKRA